MSEIKSIQGRQILDSRGNPTVEAEITLANGIRGKASVPSGASTGSQEAVELRDKHRPEFSGQGVYSAVTNINTTIQKALIGKSVLEQSEIDKILIELDGTENKSRLGACNIGSFLGFCSLCSIFFRKRIISILQSKQL